jgi:3-dehydroquinate synthase
VHRVIRDALTNGLCRHSYVIGIGGGALLDAVGFGAALVHRGLRHIRMPTTTLSQGDSGVGVKNGINLEGVKNAVGAFAPPFAVVNDLSFLATLSQGLLLDGMAEAFKVAIIKEAAFFDFLEANAAALAKGSLPLIEEAVRRSAGLHLDHIRASNDPFEFGVARPLDFGHWAAHRLEGQSGFSIRHGQAVAIGLAVDTLYARDKGLLSATESRRIIGALRQAGLPTYHHLLSARDTDGRLAVVAGLEQFREHLGGDLSVTLPKGLGHRVEIHEMDEAAIERAIRNLEERTARP